MLWVPQEGRLLRETTLNTVGDATPGNSVTTGATAPVKGAVVQLIASTVFDAYLIDVWIHGYALAANDSQLCVDIMTGAATEEIIIPDLFGGNATTDHAAGRIYTFPLYIPAGTRISARAAGQRVSTAFNLAITLHGGDAMPPFKVGRKVVTYGIGTVPFGTTIVPGASGAAGSFTEIVAATTEDHFAFLPGFQTGLDTTKGGLSYVAAIGVGAATEEEIGHWAFGIASDETGNGPWPPLPIYADVPSGTRLAMRFSGSGTLDAGNYNGVIYAVS